ncbi:MAG: hypothetical protein RI987_552, partial [Actinomycetota bacterium]
ADAVMSIPKGLLEGKVGEGPFSADTLAVART